MWRVSNSPQSSFLAIGGIGRNLSMSKQISVHLSQGSAPPIFSPDKCIEKQCDQTHDATPVFELAGEVHCRGGVAGGGHGGHGFSRLFGGGGPGAAAVLHRGQADREAGCIRFAGAET
jgi:hypothetical protein